MQNGQIIRQRIKSFFVNFIYILILDVNLHQTMLECSGVWQFPLYIIQSVFNKMIEKPMSRFTIIHLVIVN